MRTMSTTTARSSTSVIPIMMRPCRDRSWPESMSRRARTMVLATETTMPTIAPCNRGKPMTLAAPIPRAMESKMPRGPPRMATPLTRSRSRNENSTPIENMRRTTPISAKSSKVCRSETEGPGVKGPIRMPAKTYPRMRGCRVAHAAVAPRTAAMKT